MDLFNQHLDNKEKEFEKFPVLDGEIWFMRNFLLLSEVVAYLDILKATVHWRQEEIKLYGKVHSIPRKTAWYGYPGISYTYSGISCYPEPWTPELLEIKKRIEILLPGENFNSVLLNLYRDGNDKISWHSDDEKELGKDPLIASVSLGIARRFDLRHKKDPKVNIKFELSPGSLIIMKNGLQDNWQHQIPVQKKITTSRINLTFRTIKNH